MPLPSEIKDSPLREDIVVELSAGQTAVLLADDSAQGKGPCVVWMLVDVYGECRKVLQDWTEIVGAPDGSTVDLGDDIMLDITAQDVVELSRAGWALLIPRGQYPTRRNGR